MKNGGIICKFRKVGEPFRILCVAGADGLVEQGAELGIGLVEPTPVRDAVGDIRELLGGVFVEIAEDAVRYNAAVQLGDAVDTVRTHDAEIRHMHEVV